MSIPYLWMDFIMKTESGKRKKKKLEKVQVNYETFM